MEHWPRFMVAAVIGISILKIFGNKGILITLGIMALVLFLVYYFQNSLLYMPGKLTVSETSLIWRTVRKTIRKATGIPRSKDLVPKKSALRPLITSTSKAGSSKTRKIADYSFIFTKMPEVTYLSFRFGLSDSLRKAYPWKNQLRCSDGCLPGLFGQLRQTYGGRTAKRCFGSDGIRRKLQKQGIARRP